MDSIREQGVMYYCHTNKEKVKSAKELGCVTRLGGGGSEVSLQWLQRKEVKLGNKVSCVSSRNRILRCVITVVC